MDTTKGAKQSRKDYFTFKDPIMRSIFHMRDCFLQAFVQSDAVNFARNETELPLKDRLDALVQAVDAAETTEVAARGDEAESSIARSVETVGAKPAVRTRESVNNAGRGVST